MRGTMELSEHASEGYNNGLWCLSLLGDMSTWDEQRGMREAV